MNKKVLWLLAVTIIAVVLLSMNLAINRQLGVRAVSEKQNIAPTKETVKMEKEGKTANETSYDQSSQIQKQEKEEPKMQSEQLMGPQAN